MSNAGREGHDSDSSSMGPGEEQLLIDFAMGRCEEAQSEQARRRLEADADFASLHENIARTLSALDHCRPPEPPEDLAERTLARISSARRTEALLDAQSLRGRSSAPRFSIRELVALAAAAVIVVGILIPSLRQARRLADRSLCTANVGAIGAALSHYANGNDGNLPAGPAGTGVWLPRPGRKHTSNSAAMFLLVRMKYASPEVFQCPSAGGQSFILTPDMTDFPSPQSVNYSYQYSINTSLRRSMPGPAHPAQRMAILADATPIFRGGSFQPVRIRLKVSENHPDGGNNVLYMDMHVKWVTSCKVGIGGDNIWLVQGVREYSGVEKPASPTDTFLLPHPEW